MLKLTVGTACTILVVKMFLRVNIDELIGAA